MNELFALVDIDGVLADDTHRQHFAALKTPEGWTQYFSPGVMGADPVHEKGRALIASLEEEGIPFAYCSGRREDTEYTTHTWLRAGGFPENPLLLRPYYDRTPLGLMKARIARILTISNSAVLVYDDDPSVITACSVVDHVYPTLCTWQEKPGYLIGAHK